MLDYFKNDLSSFVVPSSYQLFHTAGSAAAAARYQGSLPEYLGYLGWPLFVVLAGAAIACWRRLPAGRPRSPAWCSGCSLGGTLLFGGHHHPAIKLPWYWLQGLPLLESALPDRFCLVADCSAAALLAFAVDAAVPAFAALPPAIGVRGCPLSAGWRPAAVVLAAAVLAALPIVPKPLPVAAAAPVPHGWSAAFAALRVPSLASVLVVPVPMSTFTEPLRWQADTGDRARWSAGTSWAPARAAAATSTGPARPRGRVPERPVGLLQAGQNRATGGKAPNAPPTATGYLPVRSVTNAKMRAQIRAWKVSAVVAVAAPGSRLGRYLTAILGSPAVATGDVTAWRTPR